MATCALGGQKLKNAQLKSDEEAKSGKCFLSNWSAAAEEVTLAIVNVFIQLQAGIPRLRLISVPSFLRSPSHSCKESLFAALMKKAHSYDKESPPGRGLQSQNSIVAF